MFSVRQMIGVIGVSIFILTIQFSAFASPQKVVEKDGRTYTVQDTSGQNLSRVTCTNMEVGVMANKLDNSPPNIMATITIQTGSQKRAFRLFDVAKDALTVEHDLSTMQVGCLTQNGGVGIDIAHHSSDELGLKIQIDAKGRVFLGYDQVGLELCTLPKK